MSFLEEYFINPILSNGWFNPVNTLVYSIGLVIGVLLVYKLLLRMRVPIDKHFLYSVLPFIFWASTTRVLHDSAVAGALPPALNSFYIAPFFPTPGSYFITFGLALLTLIASLLIQRRTKFPYWKTMTSAGSALCLINLLILPYITLYPAALILGMTALWTALFHIPTRLYPKVWSRTNNLILGAHFLDASATFFALSTFGYLEQHVLPRLLIELWGPVTMFPLKILVVMPALMIIDRYAENENLKTLLKIVVLILGLAPGLRDMFRLVAMV